MKSLKVLLGFLISFCVFGLGLLAYIIITIGYVEGIALAFVGYMGLIPLSIFAIKLEEIGEKQK